MSDNFNRFNEIRGEIAALIDEALHLLPEGFERQRAKSYWYGHIQGALGGQFNHCMGGSMVNMEDSSLCVDDDEDEDDDEDDFS